VVVLCWKAMTLCSLQHASTYARSRNIVYYQVKQWKTNNKSNPIVSSLCCHVHLVCPLALRFLHSASLHLAFPSVLVKFRSTHSTSSNQSHFTSPSFFAPCCSPPKDSVPLPHRFTVMTTTTAAPIYNCDGRNYCTSMISLTTTTLS